MVRKVLYQVENDVCINLNDAIGLEPLSNYSIENHIEDLESENIHLVGVSDKFFIFSDGSSRMFAEQTERIDMRSLDEETKALVLISAASYSAPSVELVHAS